MMVCGFDTCIVLNRAGDKSGMKRSIIDHINELRKQVRVESLGFCTEFRRLKEFNTKSTVDLRREL